MKNKSISLQTLLKSVLAILLLLSVFEACKKTDDPVVIPVDKSKLKARIDSATAIYTAAVEGVQVGNYEVGSKATFKNYIDAASIVNGNTAATQSDATNAYANLGVGMTNFAAKRVQEIAAANLILYLKMDGNANDASGKGFNGTLKAGAQPMSATVTSGTTTAAVSWTGWGGSATNVPALTKDRYGVDGKAYTFDKGSNIEIPYNSVLNPAKELTVAMWVRPTRIWDNNYVLSLNRWNGYKLNLQGANKVFMTVKTAPGKIIDKDNDSPTLDVNKWYHVAVSYKSGTMTFYLNGTPVKTWTDVSGDPYAVKSNINMTIGQDLPSNLYNLSTDNDADGNVFYGPWGGFFTGDLDEIRMYNVVLSDTQVKSIYNAEKP
ncbi:LamG domain-containing protein [Fibrella aquatilis]|uniref:LamG domain-containing protein n=1 Tax=Fibrella aquatilis TaxID=2817059 RepID=A0A939G3C8_9BACT|nr:LamG domain-containing protein [Fibrella aquatilis]MBO0931602.1 LamG domain-containing protein [Fibrella aquatilis]